MVPATEGQRIGLVDHLVDSEEELLPLATKEVQKLAALPGEAQALTKVGFYSVIQSLSGTHEIHAHPSNKGIHAWRICRRVG